MDVITRKLAKSLGLKRFYTGEPCDDGHLVERLVSNGTCLTCVKIRLNAWRLKNPDKVKAVDKKRNIKRRDKKILYDKIYRKENVKKLSAYKKEWALRNPEKVAVAQAKWNDKNKEAVCSYWVNRRALKKNAGKHSGEDIINIFKKQKGKCAYCKKKLKKYHVDHIMPLSKGGSNKSNNLQILCQHCNCTKHAKLPETFARELGLLV